MKVKLGMAILTGLIVIAFFMPWISIKMEKNLLSGVAEFLSGKEANLNLASISGFQIPQVANSKGNTFIISVIKLFYPGIEDADKKSYLVWIVPCLAVAIVTLFWFCGKNRWLNLVFAVIGVAIFASAADKITTTDLGKLNFKAAIDFGLWVTLFAYLGIGVLCAVNFVCISKRR